MGVYVFLGDSITDADHLFESTGLGTGFVSMIARDRRMAGQTVRNMGHDGFTSEKIYRKLLREGMDGMPDSPSVITLLAGVNDIPVEVYTSHDRIPTEFAACYEGILEYLSLAAGAQLVVMEPFLFDWPLEYKNWHPYIQKESRIIRRAASHFGARFIPTDSLLRREGERLGVDKITIDGIHLTPRGNRILADLWLEAMFPASDR